jgi:hypothetical protein
MTRIAGWLPAAVVAAGVAGCSAGSVATPEKPGPCAPLRLDVAPTAEIRRALAAGDDVWGHELLAAPDGPTLRRARRYLAPLLLARAPGRKPLTASGYHYVPFGIPVGNRGADIVALHVADGSQILADRAAGPSLTVRVGRDGRERYGSCRSRVGLPRLAGGWLPILRTTYRDQDGTSYRQESFAAPDPETGELVSFVRVVVDARTAATDARVRMVAEPGGAQIVVRVLRGTTRTTYAAWSIGPRPTGPRVAGRATYAAARRSLIGLWRARLASGAQFEVPERAVQDAIRSLLVQAQTLTWRYSVGNPYEEFSYPEALDVARVLGEYGLPGVERAILDRSLTTRPTPYANWKRGQRLLGVAEHVRRVGDRAYVAEVTPVLRPYVHAFARQVHASPHGLLDRERYSSDIPDRVLGLHSQAVAWQGLRAIAGVWSETGERRAATAALAVTATLEAGLRRAVRASQRRLADGSSFLAVRLLDDEHPYASVTEDRAGSYWNLVAPYALASGLFSPRSAESTGVRDYLLHHGSRLLGLVRAGAYALYGRSASWRTGTDQVYGNSVARFFADRDEPDQLVLSLYGALAGAMAPGTFVAGEAASIAPLGGSQLRSMYLPPNGAANAAFLETVRLMLVHETRGPDGAPDGLRLAFATPRAWLRPGRRIVVRRAPTSFGPISFTLSARSTSVRVAIELPRRRTVPSVRLRLRLPRMRTATMLFLDGRRSPRLDRANGTVDLSGLDGRHVLVVRHARHA